MMVHHHVLTARVEEVTGNFALWRFLNNTFDRGSWLGYTSKCSEWCTCRGYGNSPARISISLPFDCFHVAFLPIHTAEQFFWVLWFVPISCQLRGGGLGNPWLVYLVNQTYRWLPGLATGFWSGVSFVQLSPLIYGLWCQHKIDSIIIELND